MPTEALSVVLRFYLRGRQWLYKLYFVFFLDADRNFISCATFLSKRATVALSIVSFLFILDIDSGVMSFAMSLP